MGKHYKLIEPDCNICTKADSCKYYQEVGSKNCKKNFVCKPGILYVPEKEKKNTGVKILLLIIIILLLLLLLVTCSSRLGDRDLAIITAKGGLQFEDDIAWDGLLPENGGSQSSEETITFPGYSEIYASKDSTTALINPEENTVYMVYEIEYNGAVIYQTKAIKPGNKVDVNLAELLPIGSYDVTFNINTYNIADEAVCNGVTQVVKVIIG